MQCAGTKRIPAHSMLLLQDLVSSVKETQGADFMASQQEAQQLQEQIAVKQQDHAFAEEDEQAKEHQYK